MSRTILRRIQTRELYKCVDFKVVDWDLREIFEEKITAAHIVQAVRNMNMDVPPLIESSDSSSSVSTQEDEESLQVEDVIVDFSKMHHGMGARNPLDFVRFYSKRTPHGMSPLYIIAFSKTHLTFLIVSLEAGRGVYSNVMPPCFAEVLLRVYTRKPKFYGLVQAGYRLLLADLQATTKPADDSHVASMSTDPRTPTIPTVTPPLTEAPSTPKPHSRSSSFTFPTGGSGVAVTPFSNNQFTTVSPTFAPDSPTQGNKKAKGRKRSRDETSSLTTSTAKKRKA